MKVNIDGKVYLMHWETSKFTPKTGRNIDKKLEATDCIIRRINSDKSTYEVVRGHVSQTSGDQANRVTARRLSFLKAIEGLNRDVRKALGHEYQKLCRVKPMTSSQTNRKLRKRITEIQKALSMANSMISGGEAHSEESEKVIKSAMI